jgi:hypothetical protein
LAEELIVHEPGKIPRIKSYGEFENDCLNAEKNKWKEPWDEAAKLYTRFHPKSYPILWRIMVTQAILYQSLKNSTSKDSDPYFDFKALKVQIESKIDWRHKETEATYEEVFDQPFNASEQYLQDKLKDFL